jgi:hypothetical protein
MTTAGKILILPKGDYDSSIRYEILDLVKHDGTSWLAKKEVPEGVAPSSANSEYWQNMFDINIEAIIEQKVAEYMANHA